MKNSLIFCLLGTGICIASCTTAYKSDQTVDDVYYSPGRPGIQKAAIVKDQAQREQYQNYLTSTDEQFLRMKVANYYRWNMLDDYSYWNDSRYDFGQYNIYNSIGFNNYYSNYNWNNGWGFGFYSPIYSWGNPYYTFVKYYNPPTLIGTTSESGITAYKNKTYYNSNYTNNSYKSSYNNSNYNNSGSSNFSTLVKKVFSSSNNSYDRPVRTYDNNTNTRSYSNATNTYSSSSSNAGGNSGGVKSTGSSASSGRTTRN
jgi:hypothetical protein